MASLADLAVVVSPADLAGVASPADLAGVASSAVAGVASLAEIAGAASLAIAGVASPVVVSLAEHVGGVPIGMTSPVDRNRTGMVGVSSEGHCQDCGGTPESVGLIPTNNDLPIVEPAPIEGSEGIPESDLPVVELAPIIIGAVGSGAPWFLTGWH